jgi:hypothetical protein
MDPMSTELIQSMPGITTATVMASFVSARAAQIELATRHQEQPAWK